MKNLARSTATACLLVATLSTGAAEIDILGLPLGGKFPVNGICKTIDPLDPKTRCWVSKPFVASSGSRLGYVLLPQPKTRPMWAAYGTFNVVVSKPGLLQSLRVEHPLLDSRSETMKSIQMRFGPPATSIAAAGDTSRAQWVHPDVFIDLVCSPDIGCHTEFVTTEAKAERDAAINAHKAGRPGPP